MKEFIRKHLVKIAIGIIGILIVIGASFSYYNNKVMRDSLTLKKQSTEALQTVKSIYENIQLMDISGRGYYIIREPSYLFWSVETANNQKKSLFIKLDSILAAQGHPDPKNYADVKKGLDQYTKMYEAMVNNLKANNDSAF